MMSSITSIPVENDWKLEDEYQTAEDGLITIHKKSNDPQAQMITLVTKSGRRIVVQRTKDDSILMSSDKGGKTTRYLKVHKK